MLYLTEEQFEKILLESQLLTQERIDELKNLADSSEITLYDVITDHKIIEDEKIGVKIAEHYQVPFIDLTKSTLSDNLLHVVPERVAKKKRCVVFERSATQIKIAMEDPTDIQTQTLINAKTGQDVLVYYATPLGISHSLDAFKTDIKKAFQDLADEAEKRGDTGVEDEEAPISQLVDTLFEHAYKESASDIHLEPQDNQGLIRYRIDGILHDVVTSPKTIHERIMSRLKVLSRLRTDEHLAAQDGKVRAKIGNQMVDIRLSILPIVDGEKAVMRILSTHGRPLTLEDLGMRAADLHRVKLGYSRSFGMVLTTGPTGSGKSTSIYAILRILNTREKNITTIEDPVEYRIRGLNQINVNVKTGLTFAAGLRSILRQDPNIVSVGEIRDNETASIAVNAALTGHLVLSTLHTNDSATTMVRLTDMKVEPFLVASTVNVIIAQRLVRKICDTCRVAKMIKRQDIINCFGSALTIKYLGDKNECETYAGTGCKACAQTGYAGRQALFEVLVVTPRIRELTVKKADADTITQAAIEEGMTPISEDGLIKILNGLTSIEEVMRVTKTDSM